MLRGRCRHKNPGRRAAVQSGSGGQAVKIGASLPIPICRSPKILRFLLTTAMRAPKSTIAVALVVLAALASTLTYTTYLVVGVLADYLGTGRGMAGFLLAVLFARLPWITRSGPRIVGLLPKPARRPVMATVLALCCLHFLWHGEYVPAGFTGFAMVFLLAYPRLRRTLFDRTLSSVFPFAGRNPSKSTEDNVIDVEFKERKD